jgi:2-oxoacid:acceptor oxidoreductase delta subunit (pyruvate/2-ketoisovalerate family)
MKKNNKTIIKPTSSLNNKTGSWRTSRPETDYDKCIGCSLCAKLCPEGCIKMVKTKKGLKPKTDYDYCKGCSLCANECPVKAISMKSEY